MDVATWAEFVGADGVSNIVESIGMGPKTAYSDGRPGDESLALRVEFTYPGAGPCSHESIYHVGPYAHPLWAEADAHTAMVADARACVVAWVSRPGWPRCDGGA